jgi:hypothetical protein
MINLLRTHQHQRKETYLKRSTMKCWYKGCEMGDGWLKHFDWSKLNLIFKILSLW